MDNITDSLMIFGAEYVIYLTILLMFILAIKGSSQERKALFLALISIPILIILIKIIHLFFNVPRPFMEHDILPLIPHQADASFPSRHISLMSSFAFAYAFYKSKWTPIFLILLFWVGISRVYVGVHYPLDILGGIIFGIISLLILRQIIRLIKGRLSLH